MDLTELKHKVAQAVPFHSFVAVAGSHCYGIATDRSDIDVRGFYFHSNPSEILGFRRNERLVSVEGYDSSIWEAGHFFRMAAAANPNVIETLWIDKKYWLGCSSYIGMSVVSSRDHFMSKRIAKTFIGYAKGCLSRLEKKWDPKDASHLLRLVNSGLEAIRTGKLQVDRTGIDSGLLLEIKNKTTDDGSTLSMMKLKIEWAEQGMHDAIKSSPLPDEPDEKYLEKVLVDLYERSLGYS